MTHLQKLTSANLPSFCAVIYGGRHEFFFNRDEMEEFAEERVSEYGDTVDCYELDWQYDDLISEAKDAEFELSLQPIFSVNHPTAFEKWVVKQFRSRGEWKRYENVVVRLSY